MVDTWVQDWVCSGFAIGSAAINWLCLGLFFGAEGRILVNLCGIRSCGDFGVLEIGFVLHNWPTTAEIAEEIEYWQDGKDGKIGRAIFDTRCWMLGAGYSILDAGYLIVHGRLSMLDVRYSVRWVLYHIKCLVSNEI
mgnify:CR=1 FL=1